MRLACPCVRVRVRARVCPGAASPHFTTPPSRDRPVCCSCAAVLSRVHVQGSVGMISSGGPRFHGVSGADAPGPGSYDRASQAVPAVGALMPYVRADSPDTGNETGHRSASAIRVVFSVMFSCECGVVVRAVVV